MCTREELDELIRLLSETLPFESQGRVRMVSIIAKCALSLPRAHRHALCPALPNQAVCGRAHCFTAAQKMGRGEKTIAFYRAMAAPLPRTWELQIEQQELAAAGTVDLLVDE